MGALLLKKVKKESRAATVVVACFVALFPAAYATDAYRAAFPPDETPVVEAASATNAKPVASNKEAPVTARVAKPAAREAIISGAPVCISPKAVIQFFDNLAGDPNKNSVLIKTEHCFTVPKDQVLHLDSVGYEDTQYDGVDMVTFVSPSGVRLWAGAATKTAQ